MSGIRAEVKIESPPGCTVATAAGSAGAPSVAISRSTPSNRDGGITEEFVLEDPDENLDTDEFNHEVSEVFTYDSKRVYRFDRPGEDPCPCDFVERFGCPLQDVSVRNGGLILVFHAADIDQLQTVLTELNEQWSNVTVNRLVRSSPDRRSEDLVIVDRSALTDRQLEVLETAHEMGYFDHPMGANAGEVAAYLDINATTFTEILSAAQRKVLSAVVEE